MPRSGAAPYRAAEVFEAGALDDGSDDGAEEDGSEDVAAADVAVVEVAALDVAKRVATALGLARASLFRLLPFTRFLPVISLRT